jgi:hypothetical protein
MRQADDDLEKLIGTRTNAINRKLRGVTALSGPGESEAALLSGPGEPEAALPSGQGESGTSFLSRDLDADD